MYAVVLEKPLWSETHQLLKTKLERVGLSTDDARWLYICPDAGPGESPTLTEMKEEIPRVLEELQDVEAALLLGGPALQLVTGQTSITKNRGATKTLRREFEELEEMPMMATLHPSVVRRTPNYTNGWLSDLAAFQQLVNPPEDNDTVILVDSTEKLEELLAVMTKAERGALDIETTVGENRWDNELVTVAVCFDDETAWVIPYPTHPECPDVEVTTLMKRRFQDRFNRIEWIMHNGLFDRLMLRELTNRRLDPVLKHDTMAMAYLLRDDERKGLEILSSVYLGEPPYKGVDYQAILDEPLAKVALMNGKDTLRTFRLFRPLADELNEQPALSRIYQWLLMPAINALIRCTENGVPVDRERMADLTAMKEAAEAEALEKLRTLAPDPDPEVYEEGWPKHKDEDKSQRFNPASPQQVAHVLYDLFGLPVLKTTGTGSPSTDADTLSQLIPALDPSSPEGEFVEALLDWRGVAKQVSSYLHSWPKLWREWSDEDTRLHPGYKPLHVITGRLSSENPNIQNVPRNKEYRSLFGGVPGKRWVKADYSQLELRIGAWMAGERTMLDAYERGDDLHALTARLVLGVEDVTEEYKAGTTARDVGKTLNFGLLYGAYPKTLQRIARMNYGVYLTLPEAEQMRERFFHAYPGLARWHTRMEAAIRRDGKAVSPLGRIRWLPEAKSPEFSDWSPAVREGTNHPVQSFGSDLLLMSMVRVQDWIDRANVRAEIVAEVHDEIDLLVDEDVVDEVVAQVKEIMEDVSWLGRFGVEIGFPVVADIGIGDYWGDVE